MGGNTDPCPDLALCAAAPCSPQLKWAGAFLRLPLTPGQLGIVVTMSSLLDYLDDLGADTGSRNSDLGADTGSKDHATTSVPMNAAT